MDPGGTCYAVCTRQVETILRAWFSEILPVAHWKYRDGDIVYPRIRVHPMWALKPGFPSDPDWLIDGRVLGIYEFRAIDGDTGLAALLKLRRDLETELAALDIEERMRAKNGARESTRATAGMQLLR